MKLLHGISGWIKGERVTVSVRRKKERGNEGWEQRKRREDFANSLWLTGRWLPIVWDTLSFVMIIIEKGKNIIIIFMQIILSLILGTNEKCVKVDQTELWSKSDFGYHEDMTYDPFSSGIMNPDGSGLWVFPAQKYASGPVPSYVNPLMKIVDSSTA